MPRNPDPLGELFDRIRETLTDYAHDMIDDARRKVEPPRTPRTRRVSGKGPKVKAPRREHEGPTLYDDLEVSPHASTETIRAAWVSLCKRYHPDTGKQKSAERIKRINAAWEILGDDKKRAAYNREIRLRQ
jgi:DnaJ-class molecular chaperone